MDKFGAPTLYVNKKIPFLLVPVFIWKRNFTCHDSKAKERGFIDAIKF
jgi:hypothetical protein